MPANQSGSKPRTNTQVIRKLFGQIAVEKKYASKEQVNHALDIQNAQKARGGKHQLIGLIMLTEGILSSDQLIHILQIIDKRHGDKLKA